MEELATKAKPKAKKKTKKKVKRKRKPHGVPPKGGVGNRLRFTACRSRIEEKARDLLLSRFKTYRFKASTMLDGITAYPVLARYCKDHKISDCWVRMLIIVAHFRQFHIKYAESLGYEYKNASYYLRMLKQKGWVERFEGSKATFVLSVKGEEKFMEIRSYYQSKTKFLIENMALRLKSTEKLEKKYHDIRALNYKKFHAKKAEANRGWF